MIRPGKIAAKSSGIAESYCGASRWGNQITAETAHCTARDRDGGYQRAKSVVERPSVNAMDYNHTSVKAFLVAALRLHGHTTITILHPALSDKVSARGAEFVGWDEIG